MPAKVRAVPTAQPRRAGITIDEDAWTTLVDHVRIDPAPLSFQDDAAPLVYRLEKLDRQPLMTPAAHFYGAEAYGYLYVHDQDAGTIRLRNPTDCGQPDARRVSVLLCRRDGRALPEESTELYPAEAAVCPVGYRTWRGAELHAELCLRPDPDRVDPATTPRTRWVYAATRRGPAGEPHTVLLCPIERLRGVRRPDGSTIAFALRGLVLRPKTIAHPLLRHAGAATGPVPAAFGMAGVGRKVEVTTRLLVRLGDDFMIANKPLRVTKITKRGFVGRQILA